MNANDSHRVLAILLVDDHADGMLALKRLLEFNGHEVRTAGSVNEARQLAQQHRCDLLITDVTLPDGSGIDLFTALHAAYAIPGIVVTGHGEREYRQECEKAGFSRFVLKPFLLTDLLAAIRSAVRPS